MICYNLVLFLNKFIQIFFSSLAVLYKKICSYKNELLFFNQQELLQKSKDGYLNCGGKEKAVEYYI